MDVYILTVMNPDGYKYTWTTVYDKTIIIIIIIEMLEL